MKEAPRRPGLPAVRFDPAIIREAASTGRRGRQPAGGAAAIQTCRTMNVRFGTARRRTTGFVGNRLRLIVPDRAVPDFSPLSRRLKPLKFHIPDR